MPEFTYEMRVSSREIERPRLFQAVAHNGNDVVGGVAIHLRIDANGTFEEDDLVVEKDVVTADDGVVYFAWREWPRTGPRRDMVSHIQAMWQGEDIDVYLDDLYE
jgi:hypothetical protein